MTRSLGALMCAVAFGTFGCGYALVGRGGGIDSSIKTIAIPLFKDVTGKPLLAEKVTQRVVEEMLKRGRVNVVSKIEGADAILEGEILSYQNQPVGFGSAGGSATQANRYAITLVARVRYFKPGEKEPIWQNDSYSFREEYDVGENGGYDREDQAIERLAPVFARTLVATMLEAF